MVGQYSYGRGGYGFLYQQGTFATINYPGIYSTSVYGINDSGQMVGQAYDYWDWFPYTRYDFSFLYQGGTFTTINYYPGPSSALVHGINDSGQMVGKYADGTGFHGFLHDPTFKRLSVTQSGAGTGTVLSSPSGINCGFTCEAYFKDVVTLTATPDAGSAFGGWTRCPSPNGNTCTVTMTSDISVGALFTGSGSSWTKIAPGNPETMAAAGSLLYGGFGIDGTWKYDSGINQWTKIATGNPETMAAAGSALYGGFGIDGTWKYDSDINQWTKLAPGNPETMTAAGSLLYGGFGIDGTWKYDSDINQWTKIAPGNPEVMTAAGSLLYGDFGPDGIWQWDVPRGPRSPNTIPRP